MYLYLTAPLTTSFRQINNVMRNKRRARKLKYVRQPYKGLVILKVNLPFESYFPNAGCPDEGKKFQT